MSVGDWGCQRHWIAQELALQAVWDPDFGIEAVVGHLTRLLGPKLRTSTLHSRGQPPFMLLTTISTHSKGLISVKMP